MNVNTVLSTAQGTQASPAQAVMVVALIIVVLAVVFAGVSFSRGLAGAMPEDHEGVVFRLTKYSNRPCTGYYWRFPIGRLKEKVYMRMRTYDMVGQTTVIAGRINGGFDATALWRVVDSVFVVKNYENFESTIHKLLETATSRFLRTVSISDFLSADRRMVTELHNFVDGELRRHGCQLISIEFENLSASSTVELLLANGTLEGSTEEEDRRFSALSERLPRYVALARSLAPRADDAAVMQMALQLMAANSGSAPQLGLNINPSSA